MKQLSIFVIPAFAVISAFAGSLALAQQSPNPSAAPTPSHIVQISDLPSKDPLFPNTEKFARGAVKVSEVSLDPDHMGMVGGRHGDLAHKMRFMFVHEYKYDKPGMYNMQDVDAYRRMLEDGSWSCSVHIRERTGTQESSTDICSRENKANGTKESVIIVVKPEKLTFIHSGGTLSLGELKGEHGELHRHEHTGNSGEDSDSN